MPQLKTPGDLKSAYLGVRRVAINYNLPSAKWVNSASVLDKILDKPPCSSSAARKARK